MLLSLHKRRGEGRLKMISSGSDLSEEEPPEEQPEPSREAVETSSHVEAKADEPMSGTSSRTTKPMIPVRVQEALDASKTFSEFKAKRVFNFLHLFSGRKDVLGAAVKRMAELEGMVVECYAIDTEVNEAFNLMTDLPYHDILDDARGGKFDAAHGGPPCGSFSVVRWKEGTGPPPVRSARFIYGLPNNTPKQQLEADRGTVLSAEPSKWLGKCCRPRGFVWCQRQALLRIRQEQMKESKARRGFFQRS